MSKKRTQKQNELVNRIWEAIIAEEAEEVKIENHGSYWELNGKRIEGPSVSISPSRMRFVMENLIKKLEKIYDVEVCYQ